MKKFVIPIGFCLLLLLQGCPSQNVRNGSGKIVSGKTKVRLFKSKEARVAYLQQQRMKEGNKRVLIVKPENGMKRQQTIELVARVASDSRRVMVKVNGLLQVHPPQISDKVGPPGTLMFRNRVHLNPGRNVIQVFSVGPKKTRFASTEVYYLGKPKQLQVTAALIGKDALKLGQMASRWKPEKGLSTAYKQLTSTVKLIGPKGKVHQATQCKEEDNCAWGLFQKGKEILFKMGMAKVTPGEYQVHFQPASGGIHLYKVKVSLYPKTKSQTFLSYKIFLDKANPKFFKKRLRFRLR